MKRGYIMAELDVYDTETFYGQYMTKVKPLLEQHGARFVIGTDSPEVVEGGRSVRRVILVEFETVAKARDFYFSQEYQDISQTRFVSANSHLYIMEGLM